MGLLLAGATPSSMRGCNAPFRVSRPLGNRALMPKERDLSNARRNVLRTFAHRQLVCAASSMQNPYENPPQMDGLQSALSGLPTVGVYAVGAALAAVLGGAGVGIGGAIAPESAKTAIKAVTGIVGAAAAAFITLKLKEIRQSAAAVELANVLAQMGDPTLLTRDAVAAIETKYGIVLATDSLEDVKNLYGTFVQAVIPPGDAPLTGQEPILIQNFKAALGLQDVDAAPVHIDVGRRILRGRLESSSRNEDTEARKTFQKLIYVSGLVFGDRQAAFLLPWARIFGLTDSQLQVARRDNARNLFKTFLAANGGALKADKPFLVAVKAYQSEIRLADDEATATIQEAARSRVEELLDAAIACVKRRTRVRDYSEAVAALREAVDFNRGLTALQGDPEVPAGVGATSVAGSAWESADGRSKDLREVFRTYLEECLARDGAFTDALESDVTDLRTLMGLGTKEATTLENEVKEKLYRKLLRDEVTSGRLDAAASKAEVLGDLVEKVRFDPEAAKELHRSLYKQKLSTLLENKKLSEEDANELSRLQRLLCVPNDDRNAMHAELCGALFKDVVNHALSAGIDGFGYDDRKAVKTAFEDLKMDRTTARAILDEVARKYMLQFISTSRNTRDRIAAAKELKKMVFFSNIIVAPLVDDLKTDEDRKKEKEEAEQQKQIQEIMAKAREEAERKKKEEAEGTAPAKTDEEKEAEAKETAAALLEELETAVGEDKKEETAAEAVEGEGETLPKSLAKAEAAAQARAEGEKVGETDTVMKSQKDITLAKDLDVRDRVDIYRNFLLYCMTGDVMQGPMGVQMVTERDESEFARLSQLGDVLGLSQMDVYEVHKGLAEQAFKNQVQSYMSDGQLTPDRANALEELREKMGLPKESADKIIKGFQNQKMIAAMQAAKAQGQLTLDRVLELKDAGVEVNSLLNDDGRMTLYRQEVTARLTDGTGNFDASRMLDQLPENLELDKTKAAKVVKELSNERKRTTLVQAVSFLRQKKVADAVKSLNNLRSCAAAVPDAAVEKWDEAEEVADLYSLYCSKESDDAKRADIQHLLGLADADAANLRGIVEGGQFKMGEEAEEEEAAFF